jgi:hypothetical protein
MLFAPEILLSAFPLYLRQHALARNVPPQLLKVFVHPAIHSSAIHTGDLAYPSRYTAPFAPNV